MKRSFLLLLLLLVIGAIGWSEYTKRNPAQRFYGVGASDTRPFTVKDKWEVSWSCAGPAKISLKSTQGRAPLLLSDTTSPSMGSTYEEKGGEYSLQISSTWPWEVAVTQVTTSGK